MLKANEGDNDVCFLMITDMADIHLAHPRSCSRGWADDFKILLY